MRTGVVRLRDIVAEGRRLTGGFHVSEDQSALASLRRLDVPKQRVGELVLGRGVFRGPIFARIFVESGGEPYMSPSDIVNADARPAGYLSSRHGQLLEDLRLGEGMILVTCSGMNLGSAVWADRRLDGIVASHDLIRIVPDPDLVPPGFLFAFLASRHGHTLIRKQLYGGHIKHIEPHHVASLSVPRLGKAIERRVNELVLDSAKLLTESQAGVDRATKLLFESVGLQDITAADWHLMGRDLGFSVNAPSVDSLRALNFTPRFNHLVKSMRSTSHRSLGELVIPGTLQRGARFKRIDAAPEYSYQLLGQRELFWVKPKGRWIVKSSAGKDVLVEPGTILVAAQGTLGESELYCRAEFVWGPATQLAYSEHLLRVIADEAKVPAGCLYAFMRSETAFRMLRSISTGTKLQDHHPAMRAELPIPYPAKSIRHEVNCLVVDAYDARHKAVALDEQAISLVEDAIEKGAS